MAKKKLGSWNFPSGNRLMVYPPELSHSPKGDTDIMIRTEEGKRYRVAVVWKRTPSHHDNLYYTDFVGPKIAERISDHLQIPPFTPKTHFMGVSPEETKAVFAHMNAATGPIKSKIIKEIDVADMSVKLLEFAQGKKWGDYDSLYVALLEAAVSVFIWRISDHPDGCVCCRDDVEESRLKEHGEMLHNATQKLMDILGGSEDNLFKKIGFTPGVKVGIDSETVH